MGNNYEDDVLSLNEVMELLDIAVTKKKAFSIARFGHGELSYALWQTNPKLIKNFNFYRSYAGATGNFNSLKKEIIQSLKTTDIAGLLTLEDSNNFTVSLTNQLLKEANGYNNHICSAFITHQMIRNQLFWEWLKQQRVVLVGRRAKEAKQGFTNRRISVVNTINLEDYEQINKVEEQLSSELNWDVALIAAGIPATILAPRLANRTNRVAIDFGHAMDQIIDGEDFDHEGLVKKWNISNE